MIAGYLLFTILAVAHICNVSICIQASHKWELLQDKEYVLINPFQWPGLQPIIKQ